MFFNIMSYKIYKINYFIGGDEEKKEESKNKYEVDLGLYFKFKNEKKIVRYKTLSRRLFKEKDSDNQHTLECRDNRANGTRLSRNT